MLFVVCQNFTKAYKYKYQGQERQDELGLNWDSFKFRNYDYAIGRFMSIDPLAESYTYNSTCAFQENKMGMGTELEGKELNLHSWLKTDAVVNPNGVGAHSIGVVEGLQNTVEGLWNAVTHPKETASGLMNLAIAGATQGNQSTMIGVDNALGTNSYMTSESVKQSVSNSADKLVNGNGFERGTVVGEVVGTVLGAKGINASIKGVSNLIKANSSVNVFRVYGGDSKAAGYSWTTENPANMSNFRNAAGLPSGGASGATNTGQFVIEGTVKNKYIMNTRPALPLDGNVGGLKELIINPKNVNFNRVSGANPQF